MPKCPFKKEIRKYVNSIEENFRSCSTDCMAWQPNSKHSHEGHCLLIQQRPEIIQNSLLTSNSQYEFHE